jgi:transcriptional regulatory protein GAL4
MASIGNVVFSEIISPSTQSLLELRISRSIDNQLKAWKLSLPSYFIVHSVPEWFRGPRAIVLWKEENIRLLLWWGSKRLCTSPSDHEEAQNMCNFTAVETIQDISNFCSDNSEILHTGVSWYATYYLFQAAVVLSIHHLRPMKSIDRGLEAVSQELWFSSITRSHDCLASLSRTNTAATRCLEVLERISDQPQHAQAQHPSSLVSELQINRQPESILQEAAPGDVEIPSTILAVDPTLQMLFEDTPWDKDLFQGLHGFPSTGEGEAFDYLPSNTDQGWLRSSDPGGQG